MSYQLNSYAVANIGHQRQQELLREAKEFRLMRTLPTPNANIVQRMITKFSNQIAEGMRAMTRQPRSMQGAS